MKIPDITQIIVHADCPDGIASGVILERLPQAQFAKVVYANHEDLKVLPAQQGQIFCDICPPLERVAEFRDVGAIVLDHHASTREVVEKFGPQGVYGGTWESGASLAYKLYDSVVEVQRADFFGYYPDTFAKLISIRDTYQRDHRLWEEACLLSTAVRFFKKSVLSWEATARILVNDRKDRAKKAVEKGILQVYQGATTSYNVLYVNSTDTTDMTEYTDVDLIVGASLHFGLTTPEYQVSLRSPSGKVPCNLVAEHYQGGGHKGAAGFRTAENPMDGIRDAFMRATWG